MQQIFMFLGYYIIIGLIVAVVVNSIEISRAKANNKEIIALQGPLAGIVWPLSILVLVSFLFSIAFSKVSEFLAIKLLNILKVE